MRTFTHLEERAEIERLARLMCRAMHIQDPDSLVCKGEPPQVGGFYVIDYSAFMPLWQAFIPAAKTIFDDQRRREENAVISAESI